MNRYFDLELTPRIWGLINEDGPSCVGGTRCWLWIGRKNTDGYGMVDIGGKKRLSAHKVFYTCLIGDVESGLELDHLCRNRSCVNPSHLEPVTHAENMSRGVRATQQVCKNGHPYNETNTYHLKGGRRDCRVCIRDRTRAWRLRKATSKS